MKNIRTYEVNTDVYKASKKIRLEEDQSLPDYCSDITRVIKAEGFPVLYSKRTYVRDGALFCDVAGSISFNVVYLTEGENTESYSFTSEFNDTLRTEATDIDEDSVFAFVVPALENTVCRVQSPRRISISTVISLDTDIRANRVLNCYSGEGSPVETVERNTFAVRSVCSKDGEFKLSEEIKLPKSCPPMERILSAAVTVDCENTSAGDNSISFWGNAGILCVYLPEADEKPEIQSFYQPLDIKGSLDVEDSRSDMTAIVRLVPASFSCEIFADDLGENRVLKAELSYTAQCLVNENVPVELIEDIYGVGCETASQYDRRELRRYAGTLKEDTAVKERIPLKKDVVALEGVMAYPTFKGTYFENGELYADCRVSICAMGITEDSLCPVNETMDLAVHLNLPSEISAMKDGLSFDVCMHIGFVDAKVSEGCAELSFDLTTVAHIFYGEELTFVLSVEIKERMVSSGERIFCYPSENDTLWTVGKRYGVSRSALASANSITASDKLKRVMVIPD